jgi:hypothetical protein
VEHDNSEHQVNLNNIIISLLRAEFVNVVVLA